MRASDYLAKQLQKLGIKQMPSHFKGTFKARTQMQHGKIRNDAYAAIVSKRTHGPYGTTTERSHLRLYPNYFTLPKEARKKVIKHEAIHLAGIHKHDSTFRYYAKQLGTGASVMEILGEKPKLYGGFKHSRKKIFIREFESVDEARRYQRSGQMSEDMRRLSVEKGYSTLKIHL